ncbi:hypothetical protein [Natrinema sp. HArc-T2]|uniref:hypothetical protein n=1 Tax=Natrinema sp. HArc-T2 TaxID=3242701 RepID=UPI00359DDF70
MYLSVTEWSLQRSIIFPQALSEYFESYVPYLVVALLEEDAQAIEAPHSTITDL